MFFNCASIALAAFALRVHASPLATTTNPSAPVSTPDITKQPYNPPIKSENFNSIIHCNTGGFTKTTGVFDGADYQSIGTFDIAAGPKTCSKWYNTDGVSVEACNDNPYEISIESTDIYAWATQSIKTCGGNGGFSAQAFPPYSNWNIVVQGYLPETIV